jgi:hypothetical protein
MVLSSDDLLALDGLLTNILLGRFELTRKGEEVKLTPEEIAAIKNLKELRARASKNVHRLV